MKDVYKSILNNINSYELKDNKVGKNRIDLMKETNQRFYDKLKGFEKIDDPSIDQIHNSMEKHIQQQEERLRDKKCHPVMKEIEELMKLRKSDPKEEFERLTKLPRIQTALQKKDLKIGEFWKRLESLKGSDETAYYNLFNVYLHSLELQGKLENSHYVFNHGQTMKMMAINMLARQLKGYHEENQYTGTETLRHNVYQEKLTGEKMTHSTLQGNNYPKIYGQQSECGTPLCRHGFR